MEVEAQRRRRILVVGASGPLGAHVLARLQARRVEIVGLDTDTEAAERRFPFVRWVAGDVAAIREVENWRELLDGVEAVVACTDTLGEGIPDARSEAVADGLAALYRACADLHIRRVVHIATSVQSRASEQLEGELEALDLDWLILRPGFVLSPSPHGLSALARALAACPLFVPAIQGRAVVQPVSIEDVAEAAVRGTELWRSARMSIDLVTPEAIAFSDLLHTLRAWLGLPAAPVLRLPAFLVWPLAMIANLLAALGWTSPMRSASLRRLKAGIQGDAGLAQRVLGLKPRDLATILAGWPTGPQERWFARLYFLSPLAIATLAITFVATGVIALTEIDLADFTLAAGWPTLAIHVATVLAAIGAIVLGVGATTKKRCRTALRGMILAAIGYLAVLSVFQPALWLDPLGPLVKVVPAIMLAAVILPTLGKR